MTRILPRAYWVVPLVLQAIAWAPVRLLLIIFCRFEVRGKENLTGLTQAIFAVNHNNELDPIILTAALSPFSSFAPMFYILAPVEYFQSGKFAWRRYIYSRSFFEAWGAFAIQRGLKDYGRTLTAHVELLRDGRNLCVFPEGGMTKDGTLKEGHGGVAYLTNISNVPVVPVGISGTYRLGLKEFFRRKHHIRLTFGIPLRAYNIMPTEEKLTLGEDSKYKIATQVVMDRISRMLIREKSDTEDQI